MVTHAQKSLPGNLNRCSCLWMSARIMTMVNLPFLSHTILCKCIRRHPKKTVVGLTCCPQPRFLSIGVLLLDEQNPPEGSTDYSISKWTRQILRQHQMYNGLLGVLRPLQSRFVSCIKVSASCLFTASRTSLFSMLYH